VKVKTGVHAPSRPCGSCGLVINMADLPWFTGAVFCSDRCQLLGGRAAVSAVLQTAEKQPNMSDSVEKTP
jgi:endogenous inhibitor of DNA gyrase (YacG/DUF329 family)